MLNSVTSAVNEICHCGFSGQIIHDTTATFQCFDNSPTAVTFRGEIGSTVGANSSQLQVISYMEQWVATNPTVVVQNSTLRIDGNCNVKIDSFNDPECSPMISTMDDNSVNIGAVIGVVGGVTTTLAIAVSLVVIVALLLKTRQKKASQEVDRNRANIYEYVHVL